MNLEETRRVWELPRYFVVHPAFTCVYRNIQYDYPDVLNQSVQRPYNSENETPMSREQLARFLKKNHLLEETAGEAHPAERFWPNGFCEI